MSGAPDTPSRPHGPYKVRLWRLTLLLSLRRCQPFAIERGVLRFGWGLILWV